MVPYVDIDESRSMPKKSPSNFIKGKDMSFCTAINCMDGRVQLPLIGYLKSRFKVEYIDSVTEAGPVLYLAEKTDSQQTKSILQRIDISINNHQSKAIAVIAHHDCAGNPVDDQTQIAQLTSATNFLADHYPNVEIIGLWVDSNWSTEEIC